MGIICLFIKSYWRTLKKKNIPRALQNVWRIMITKPLFYTKMNSYICPWTLSVPLKFAGFLEIRSVRILKQIMSEDKYPCIFSRQVEAIVSILLRYN